MRWYQDIVLRQLIFSINARYSIAGVFFKDIVAHLANAPVSTLLGHLIFLLLQAARRVHPAVGITIIPEMRGSRRLMYVQQECRIVHVSERGSEISTGKELPRGRESPKSLPVSSVGRFVTNRGVACQEPILFPKIYRCGTPLSHVLGEQRYPCHRIPSH